MAREPIIAVRYPHLVRRSLGEDGSLEIVTAKCEPSLKDAKPELRYQFERLAYFTLDTDSSSGN